MVLNMNWKNFRSIHGEEGSRSKFENLMYDILCREYPSEKVHKTDSSRGGDGGIDIFVESDGGIDIYQCKFFLDAMDRTQWNQIAASFESSMKTAQKDGVKVLKWYLCTPFISNRDPVGPWKRWNTFVDENARRIEVSIEWLDGARIIQKLEQPELGDIRFKYFTSDEKVIQKEGVVKEVLYREAKDMTTTIQITADTHPKVFISYSWTNKEYMNRVLNLAIRLRAAGVDVILDQWDLRPGYDMYAFMEQSIHDADKVLILCDKGYAEKADNRSGGVGAETMIITPDVYGKYKQEKFIPVIMETPKAVPSYLKSRYAVFYTKDGVEEYQALCQAIFGVFGVKKPPMGKIPIEWLTGDSSTHKSLSSNVTVSTDSKQTQRPALRKGEKYKFGHYPKVKDGQDEPLLWRVLDVDTENKRALLITEDLIDCRKYNEICEVKSITWEVCDLRKWLNGAFVDRTFGSEDQTRIVEVDNVNPDNKDYGTKGGKKTRDRVFALSIDEAKAYFRDDLNRRAAATPYADSHGSYTSKNYTTSDDRRAGWWWLRSPGSNSIDASVIDYDGSVYTFGLTVNFDHVSVRPALWLNL